MKILTLSLTLASLALVAGCPPAEEGTPDAPPGGVQATFTSLYADYFAKCKNCHTPTAPGRTSDTEQTLDFTTKASAYTTITTGVAMGLVGNHAGCNGAPFVGSTPASSLILAVLDQPTRQAIDLPGFANCDIDAITDATVKSGAQPSAAFVTALKEWITAGKPNN
ncbi:MAG: hypothetical protein R3B48_22625 [Kofleriaceae bacterium]